MTDRNDDPTKQVQQIKLSDIEKSSKNMTKKSFKEAYEEAKANGAAQLVAMTPEARAS